MRFEQTCPACPEQYDVWDGKRKVGYVRLRWSRLTVTCPDVGGKLVYEAQIGDSGWDGCFETPEQRQHHFNHIKNAIKQWLDKR